MSATILLAAETKGWSVSCESLFAVNANFTLASDFGKNKNELSREL